MLLRFRFAPLALFGLLSAGCQSAGGGKAVTAADLAGHWNVAAIVSRGGEETGVPAMSEAFVDFELADGTAGGTASGKGGVNRFTTTWEIRATMLVMKPAAATKMAGPPDAMKFESDLLQLLSEPLHPRPRGGGMLLSGPEGAVKLTR